jgi:RNA polymerase sigma-70 factor (ECF subfamily)
MAGLESVQLDKSQSRQNLSDPDLMNLARYGDRAAFGVIIQRHQDRLFNSLLRLLGDADDAAEVAQETFARGLARIEDYPESLEPYQWLFRLGLNLAVSALRKGRRRPATAWAADQAAPQRPLLAALGRVDTDYRAVLVMRDIEGMDYQMMADALALPPATVKSRLFRARLALRDELSKKP